MARFRLELGPIPLHHQVYLDLKAALDGREWVPGDRMPTERDLAARYGCSLITIRRALSELVRESRLERTRGRGTFVLPPRFDVDFAGTLSFTEEMQTRGLDPARGSCPCRRRPARRGHGLASAQSPLYLERSGWPMASRCSSTGAPAGRALPRPACLDLGTGRL
jgi:GntR family transcriptional regulator